jgi:hypothetical protein
MPERRNAAVHRETELEMRRKPGAFERIAGRTHLANDVVEVLLDEVRQHEAVVQLGSPAHQSLRRVRRAPEAGDQGPQQQLLGQRHACMRRHFESAHLEQTEAAGRAVGRVQLVDAELGAMRVAGRVDQQVAQHAVDDPGRDALAAIADGRRELAEGDLEFIDRIVARLVDARRLTGRADEQAREKIRQRGVVVPVTDQAAQQVGAAQERRVEGGGPTEDEMVAAAGAGMATVEHELFGAQARQVGGLVEMRRPRPVHPNWRTAGC